MKAKIVVNIDINSDNKYCNSSCSYFKEVLTQETDYCKIFNKDLVTDSCGSFRCAECHNMELRGQALDEWDASRID